MGRLDGKVAVITGAASGIGREAAALFASEGARVCVADLEAAAGPGEEAAAACGEAFFQPLDVKDPASVQQMYAAAVERYGGVDVLYNNAGVMPPDDDSILVTEPDAWDRVQAVNARGVYLCCKYAQENQHYHRHEWLVGGWDLSVDLPQRVDPTAARATLNLGVLVVTAPTSEAGSGESRPAIRET